MPTARTRSNSKVKPKPVKKKPATKKKTFPNVWDVYWVRSTNGDEFIAEGLPMMDGIALNEPAVITYLEGAIVLAPYGMMAAERVFFLNNDCVLHSGLVSPAMTELYRLSIKNSLEYCQTYFDGLIARSIQSASKPLGVRSEPTPEQIAEVEAMMDDVTRVPEKKRSRQETIDDLVKLADNLGKGKNKSD